MKCLKYRRFYLLLPMGAFWLVLMIQLRHLQPPLFDSPKETAESSGKLEHNGITQQGLRTKPWVGKPWVGMEWVLRQDKKDNQTLWPDIQNPWNDRIVAQLSYKPQSDANIQPLKKIFVALNTKDPLGQEYFETNGCMVTSCFLTKDNDDLEDVDAQIGNPGWFLGREKPPGQIWIMYMLESPVNYNPARRDYFLTKFNWTATYRTDSTLVTPYEKFVFYENASEVLMGPSTNYASRKQKLVAWFVSNCRSTNKRLEYAEELAKYISVDIYGGCGNLSCWRDTDSCFKMLKEEYKFYLSFENSNCQYYITEKFFQNALMNDVVPVVMGARKVDYVAAAPPHSFIHVEDFDSPKELASYLHMLDKNDNLYNEYFQWKKSGEFINTKFWCRLCALLHDDSPHESWYDRFPAWWRDKGICTMDRWDKASDLILEWGGLSRANHQYSVRNVTKRQWLL